jgi:hypothetical protein
VETQQVPSGAATAFVKDTEAFHRALRILTSTLCVWDDELAIWVAMTEKEARVAAAALARSHMLVVPPDVATRNLGIRPVEEQPSED